jgi:hypothetical protein
MKKNISILTGAGIGASVGAKNSFRDAVLIAPIAIGTATTVSKIATGHFNIGKIAKTTGIVAGGYITAATIAGAIVGIGGAVTINEFIDEFGDSDEEIAEFIEKEECC